VQTIQAFQGVRLIRFLSTIPRERDYDRSRGFLNRSDTAEKILAFLRHFPTLVARATLFDNVADNGTATVDSKANPVKYERQRRSASLRVRVCECALTSVMLRFAYAICEILRLQKQRVVAMRGSCLGFDVIKREEEFIRHIIIRVNASSIIRPDVTLLSYATFFHFRTIPHRSVRNGVNVRGSPAFQSVAFRKKSRYAGNFLLPLAAYVKCLAIYSLSFDSIVSHGARSQPIAASAGRQSEADTKPTCERVHATINEKSIRLEFYSNEQRPAGTYTRY